MDPVEVQEGFVLQGQQFEVAVKSVGYKGEKWWREYERHYKGTLDLRAKLLPESVAAIKSRPPEKTIQAPRRPDDLRTDPRLQVKLSATFKKPTVPEVLTLIQNASGVPLSCDVGEDAEKPAFMSLSLNKSPAWVVMERLAKSEIVAGHWEPTETGYRLVRTVGPPPTNPVFVVVLWLGAGIAGLSCLLLARWYFRHRAKQKPSQAQDMTGPTGNRPAFTLVELLVVLAIVGVLIGLLVPAIQQVRASAQRIAYGSNLRQLALAVQAYHDAHKRIPYNQFLGP